MGDGLDSRSIRLANDRAPRQLFLSSAVIGILIGIAVVVVPPMFVVAPSSHTPAPNFSFYLNMSGSFRSAGVYQYNLSFIWLTPGNVTADWVQFQVYSPTPLAPVNVTVRLFSSGGVDLALFNSSQSTWSGSSAGGNLTLPSMGGWVSGGDQPVVGSDYFQVSSTQSLANRQLDSAMSLSTVPHYGAAQLVPL
jgi:hypothetical protein